MRIALACLVTLLCTALPCLAAQSAGVVVSIKPLHSLVSAIMGETGQPTLLVAEHDSLHGFQLRPSHLRVLHHAELVFYADARIETFMTKALASAPDSVTAIELSHTPALTLLPRRTGALWEKHHHHDANHSHSPLPDLHFWLDADNAITLSHQIERMLTQHFPKHQNAYQANALALRARIRKADATARQQLAPVKDVPFIVFHDALQYVESRYQLHGAGSITFEPNEPASIARVQAIRDRLQQHTIACVFTEPYANPKPVERAIESSGARIATLDPDATALKAGAHLYPTLLEQIARDLATCLSAAR